MIDREGTPRAESAQDLATKGKGFATADHLTVETEDLAAEGDLAVESEELPAEGDHLVETEDRADLDEDLGGEDQGAGAPGPARRAFATIRTGVATASEPIVDRIGQAMDGVERTWSERPGARVRRVRRMGKSPLPHLYDAHPEARSARPVDIGLETIDVTEIAGTAVGGGDQRGGDFLPLRPFRGHNWRARWQRLRGAHEALAVLPPIDLVKFADRFWVTDGHNRVGLALYGGQVAIDANVVELVPLGERRTEPVLPLAPTVAASQAVRTAGDGRPPSHELGHEDSVPIDPPDIAG